MRQRCCGEQRYGCGGPSELEAFMGSWLALDMGLGVGDMSLCSLKRGMSVGLAWAWRGFAGGDWGSNLDSSGLKLLLNLVSIELDWLAG